MNTMMTAMVRSTARASSAEERARATVAPALLLCLRVLRKSPVERDRNKIVGGADISISGVDKRSEKTAPIAAPALSVFDWSKRVWKKETDVAIYIAKTAAPNTRKTIDAMSVPFPFLGFAVAFVLHLQFCERYFVSSVLFWLGSTSGSFCSIALRSPIEVCPHYSKPFSIFATVRGTEFNEFSPDPRYSPKNAETENFSACCYY